MFSSVIHVILFFASHFHKIFFYFLYLALSVYYKICSKAILNFFYRSPPLTASKQRGTDQRKRQEKYGEKLQNFTLIREILQRFREKYSRSIIWGGFILSLFLSSLAGKCEGKGAETVPEAGQWEPVLEKIRWRPDNTWQTAVHGGLRHRRRI